ncbi:MAG: 4-hydroxy-tetrahydrodipicolinate reductase [Chitinispirillaceae bacterium]|nr:4-hydroxy-tetrahydrodipicolinate reductase [Chitinispirillaceae bacterium]
MSLEIVIIGALGRMGKEIAEIVLSNEKLSLVGAIEAPNHPSIGKNYGSCIGKNVEVKINTSLSEVKCERGVCIDFSSPKTIYQYLPIAAERKMPVVIGTTGLSDEDIAFVKSFSSKIPVIISPNMSLGINLLFVLTEKVASILKDSFDIEIIEAHHRFKKDSPSGTAKRLAEIVAKAFEEKADVEFKHGRNGIVGERKPTEIGVHAVRGGDIVGDHTVLFAGIGERIELKHMAHSRATFAKGAVVAAEWIYNKPPAFYTMRDVLGL